MKELKPFILTTLCLILASVSGAQSISVTENSDADDLVDLLITNTDNITIVNSTYIGAEGAAGSFEDGDFGIEQGLLLTTGAIANAVGPNVGEGTSTSNSTPGDPDLDSLAAPFTTNDASILEITFIPNGTNLQFSYVFGSDEYNEYVCSSFNDVFGFFIDGGAYDNENIAILPGTDIPVTINNVNNGSVGDIGDPDNCDPDQLMNSAFFVDNAEGENIEYDGYTVVLPISIELEPGETYTIRLAVADAGDTVFDSAVFIEGGSFEVVDCADLQANIGDSCDDGDDTTEDDTVTADCECIGTSIFDCPDLEANVGDACDDENDLTENDTVNQNCECEGTPVNQFDCPQLEANIGDDCDDDDPTTENDLITENCECEGTSVPQFDCPDLQANFGDDCESEDGLGILNENCECVVEPSSGVDCDNWVVYLANNLPSDVTDIYAVDFAGGNANLSFIATTDIEVHIAYNESNDLIYAVSNDDGSYRTLDPKADSPAFSEVNAIDVEINRITQAAFDLEGNLIIGDSGSDIIYSVDVSTNTATVIDSSSPIEGGDIAYGVDGTAYMSTRDNGGELYTLSAEGNPDVLIGDLPSTVTSLALSSENKLLSASAGNTSFTVSNLDGSDSGNSFNVLLDGEPFTLGAGDMASGCASPDFVEGECEEFTTLYMDNEPNAPTLYGVEFVGSEAQLTPITGSDFRAHIAYNAEEELVYFVNRNGNNFTIFDLELGYLADIPIDGNLSGTHSAVYNPADGFLYVGSSNDDKIYTVDVITGESTVIADAPAQGGDLSLQDGTLYLAVRGANELYTVSGGSATLVGSIPSQASGMARANNNFSLIISKANSSTFREVGLDGSDIMTYEATLFGESFGLAGGGDMAAGCADGEPNIEDCENFRTFYVDHGPGIDGSNLYSVDYSGSNVILNLITAVDFQAHIAYNADANIVYLVNANGSEVVFYDPELGVQGQVEIDGDIDQLFAVVYNPADGLIYVGDDGEDEIYTIDPVSGAVAFVTEASVNGGDLSLQNGVLYLADRTNNHLIEVATNTILGDIPSEANGMARTGDGSGLVISRAESNEFVEIGTDASVITTYTALLDGEPFTLSNGDMAAGCASGDDVEDDCNYQLYYTHRATAGNGEYELYGVTLNEEGTADITYIDNLEGGHIALSPDGSHLYDVNQGSVRTYEFGTGVTNNVNIFDGADDSNLSGFPAAVTNSDGDLFIAGAGNNVWQLDPMTGEATNIASNISVSGGDLIFAPTGENGEDELWIINRNQGSFTRVLDPNNGSFTVDIGEINGAAVLPNGNVLVADGDQDGEAGFIEINLETLEMTEYDVDLPLFWGDLAGGCTEVEEQEEIPSFTAAHVGTTIETFPNPTTGISNVVFTSMDTERITLEVYDMNGRNVATLFNQVANAGQEYLLNFDGSALPNGIYIYRLTKDSEVTIEKFMISR